MRELNGADLDDNYLIDDVILNNATISRNEGYYIANLNMKIDIV